MAEKNPKYATMIFELPEKCMNCQFCFSPYHGRNDCFLTRTEIPDIKKRMGNCPMKEIPRKSPTDRSIEEILDEIMEIPIIQKEKFHEFMVEKGMMELWILLSEIREVHRKEMTDKE